MSIPPGGYNAAPPPPSKSGSGRLLAGFGIGCGVIILLAVIGVFLVARKVQQQIAHPSRNSFMGTAINAGKAGMDGAIIRQAIVRYHHQHGHYPATLTTLVQDGSLSAKVLHNDLDDSPDPGHVSWRYVKPDENAPGETPILEEPYHVTLGGRTQPGRIIIALDGRNIPNSPSNAPNSP